MDPTPWQPSKFHLELWLLPKTAPALLKEEHFKFLADVIKSNNLTTVCWRTMTFVNPGKKLFVTDWRCFVGKKKNTLLYPTNSNFWEKKKELCIFAKASNFCIRPYAACKPRSEQKTPKIYVYYVQFNLQVQIIVWLLTKEQLFWRPENEPKVGYFLSDR